VWEFRLSGLTNLIDYVVPFYLKYVIPFSGKVKEFNTFRQVEMKTSRNLNLGNNEKSILPKRV